jgi:formate hydrogenlyase subunit 4
MSEWVGGFDCFAKVGFFILLVVLYLVHGSMHLSGVIHIVQVNRWIHGSLVLTIVALVAALGWAWSMNMNLNIV